MQIAPTTGRKNSHAYMRRPLFTDLCSLLTDLCLMHQDRAICKSPLPQNAKILMPIWGNLCSLTSAHCSLLTDLCSLTSAH
ncbi:hypothetical protein [Capnocytophaga gingivalis]|uniref:hypothetical protein n=1 Tax=Capnocytophaga gingivalis TaxID=1017 RepID=UPI0028D01F6C|nr:hypothetical protein [Capnocytophaga gingivalis]